MKKSVLLWLRPIIVLSALALNACSGVQGEFNLSSSDPAVQAASSGSSSENSQGEATHEVKGVVTAIDANSITVDGVVYYNIANLDALAGVLQVGDVVKLEFTQNPDGTLTVRAEIASAEETPEATETPEVGETPEATETPDDQDENEVVGVVTAIDATTITIDGVVYNLADFTKIEGTIQVGDVVKLEFVVNPDGTLTVREVKVADHNANDSDSLNSDDSQDDNHDSHDDHSEDHDSDHNNGHDDEEHPDDD